MDMFGGDQEATASNHKYLFCESDPINNVGPSGQDIGEMMAVINIVSSFFAAIGLAASKATSLVVTLPALSTSKNTQLLVGLIFAESSSKNYGGGEHDNEKMEMGLTVLNRTYYATKKAPSSPMQKFLRVGSHTFYSSKLAREAQ